MILLYGMPSLVAGGLLFVGFIYCMAYVLNFFEHLYNKKKKRPITSDIGKNDTQRDKIKRTEVQKSPIVRYKAILHIKSDVATINNDSSYVLLAIKEAKVDDKVMPILEEYDKKNVVRNFGEVEENVDSYWRLEVNDDNFDETKIKFICIYKDEECNDFSIYSASEIIYGEKRYRIFRIKDLRSVNSYKLSAAFDNWANSSGLNSRPSISELANKRVLNNE